jgi:uncharacterized membrane protein
MRSLTLEEMKKVSGGMDYAVPVPPNPGSFKEAVIIGGVIGGAIAGPPGAVVGAMEGGFGYIGYNVYQNGAYYATHRNNSEFSNSTFNSFRWQPVI